MNPGRDISANKCPVVCRSHNRLRLNYNCVVTQAGDTELGDWMSCRAVVWFAAAVTALFPSPTMAQISAGDWPQFRGWRARGVVDGQDLPDSWDADAFANIRWKTPIPGLGHSSPILAGNRIFLVTAIGNDANPSLRVGLYGDIRPVDDEGPQSWQLYCLNKQTGQIDWIRQLHYGEPAIKRHTKASHANSTPATDGKHVVAFLGSEGLHCFDVCGNRLWKKDLGRLDSGYYMARSAQWGFGSSPIIYQDLVFVQCDVQKNSFVAAFEIDTGDEIWRTKRTDVPTWGTPTVHEGEHDQLIVNGCSHSGGYDPRTGREIWQLGWGGDIPVPTPIVSHGLIILSSAHGLLSPLRAVRTSAHGTVPPMAGSQKQLAWSKPRDGIYMQTPLVYEDLLYACRDNGVLSCYDVETGERIYRKRLGGGGFTASPVAADGRLYFTSEDGVIYVVRAGKEYELLAENAMGEVCMATPAISDQMLIVRGQNSIYAVGKPRRASPTSIELARATAHAPPESLPTYVETTQTPALTFVHEEAQSVACCRQTKLCRRPCCGRHGRRFFHRR